MLHPPPMSREICCWQYELYGWHWMPYTRVPFGQCSSAQPISVIVSALISFCCAGSMPLQKWEGPIDDSGIWHCCSTIVNSLAVQYSWREKMTTLANMLFCLRAEQPEQQDHMKATWKQHLFKPARYCNASLLNLLVHIVKITCTELINIRRIHHTEVTEHVCDDCVKPHMVVDLKW